jgi:hypothetical protein
MNKKISIIATACILIFSNFASGNAAFGDTLDPQSPSSRTFTTRSQACEEALTAANLESSISSECDETVTISVGEGTPVSAAELQAQASKMPAKTFAAFSAATVAPLSRTFSFTVNTAAESLAIKGRAYYDYSHVWVTQTYSGTRGSLQCVVNFALGADITNTSCTDTGTPYIRTLTGVFHTVALQVIASWDSTYVGHVDDTGYAY